MISGNHELGCSYHKGKKCDCILTSKLRARVVEQADTEDLKSSALNEHEGSIPSSGTITDGHHTMSELYEHRHALFCALCKIYDSYVTPLGSRVRCWKSYLHYDGTMYEGWFIAGMTISEIDGSTKYVSYHLPLSWWDKFTVPEWEHAPKYTGYTSEDVIKTLISL